MADIQNEPSGIFIKQEAIEFKHSQLLVRSSCKIAATILVSAFLGFLPLLIIKWVISLRVKLFYSKATTQTAKCVHIINIEGRHYLIDLERVGNNHLRMTYKHSYYLLEKECWVKLDFTNTFKYHQLRHTNDPQLTLEEIHTHQELYGKCLIDVPIQSITSLLVDEVLSPFYIFQIFAFVVWIIENYYIFAVVILLITLFSMGYEIFETRTNEINIKNIAMDNCKATLIRNKQPQELQSIFIVPGDIIVITPTNSMPCDCLLLDGKCIANEAIITGESNPTNKLPAIHNATELLSTHMLYTGTKILQSTGPFNKCAIAMVIHTGFNTAKGQLMKSILTPPKSCEGTQADAMVFMGIISTLSAIGFLCCLPIFIGFKVKATVWVMKFLDFLTIIVPPSLPAALGVGTSFALRRLRNSLIFCTSPHKIDIAGKLNVVVFDKTGTITSDGLSVKGFRIAKQLKAETTFSRVCTDIDISLCESISNYQKLLECLGCCHSLSKVRINNQVSIVGDPLDMEMFKYSGWKIQESCENGVDQMESCFQHEDKTPIYYLKLKTFEFDATIKCMSAIVKNMVTSKLFGVIKGAPEAIYELCDKSTVPLNYHSVLKLHAENGNRVLALGYKNIEDNKMNQIKREDLEKDIIFIGFLILNNKLKPTSKGVIDELHSSGIDAIMSTGDNILTAISVGLSSNILEKTKNIAYGQLENSSIKWEIFKANSTNEEVEFINEDEETMSLLTHPDKMQEIDEPKPWMSSNYQIAITGEAFEYLLQRASMNNASLQAFFRNTKIYARMTPIMKAAAIEKYKKCLGGYIAMCGDGANDCGALKAADVGIALSNSEASVAAPFTYGNSNITCVTTLIKEGRAALATSIQCFKFMAMYSIIQFTSYVLLWMQLKILADMHAMIEDLFIIMALAISSNYSHACTTICKQRPITNLINFEIIGSLISQVVLMLGYNLFILYALSVLPNNNMGFQKQFLKQKELYNEKMYLSTEESTIFLLSIPILLGCSIAFARGEPYRETMFKNYWYGGVIAVIFGFWLFLTIKPHRAIRKFLGVY